MTKPKPERSHTILPRTASPIQLTSQPPTQSTPTPSVVANTPGSNQSTFTRKSDASGYLGLTSYSSTLHHSDFQPPAEIIHDVGGDDNQEFDAHEVAIGVHVLKHIPDEKTAFLFLDICFENTKGFVGIPKAIVRKMLASTFAAFGHSFSYPWNEHELEKTAKCIIQNGHRSLTEPDDPNDWASQDQIRWDLIGMFFVSFAYALLSSNHKKHALVDEEIGHRDRKVVVREIKKCIEICMDLSRKSLCPRFVNLIYKYLLLETVLEGDSSE